MNLELQATPEEVMRAVSALEAFARDQQLPDEKIFGLMLALEECASNIVNHALERDPRRQFCVAFDRTDSELWIELCDSGPEFDPTKTAMRQPQASDSDLPGGWGIQLVRRYVDKITYRREGDRNILRLVKRLGNNPNAQTFVGIF